MHALPQRSITRRPFPLVPPTGTVPISGARAGRRVAVAATMSIRGLPSLPLLLDPAPLLLLPRMAALSDTLGIPIVLLARPMLLLLLLEGIVVVLLA